MSEAILAGAAAAAIAEGLPVFPEAPPMLSDLATRLAEDPRPCTAERPWDLSTLPAAWRPDLYAWLQRTVIWHNATFAWQPATVIPPCWPLHPGLTADWLVVVSARAERARSPLTLPLLEWHERTLVGFHNRMNAALGAAAADCRAGRHKPAPAALGVPAWNAAARLVWGPAPHANEGEPK